MGNGIDWSTAAIVGLATDTGEGPSGLFASLGRRQSPSSQSGKGIWSENRLEASLRPAKSDMERGSGCGCGARSTQVDGRSARAQGTSSFDPPRAVTQAFWQRVPTPTGARSFLRLPSALAAFGGSVDPTSGVESAGWRLRLIELASCAGETFLDAGHLPSGLDDEGTPTGFHLDYVWVLTGACGGAFRFRILPLDERIWPAESLQRFCGHAVATQIDGITTLSIDASDVIHLNLEMKFWRVPLGSSKLEKVGRAKVGLAMEGLRGWAGPAGDPATGEVNGSFSLWGPTGVLLGSNPTFFFYGKSCRTCTMFRQFLMTAAQRALGWRAFPFLSAVKGYFDTSDYLGTDDASINASLQIIGAVSNLFDLETSACGEWVMRECLPLSGAIHGPSAPHMSS